VFGSCLARIVWRAMAVFVKRYGEEVKGHEASVEVRAGEEGRGERPGSVKVNALAGSR
jgi:hypothetical protein